jgi:hypothetical protein
MQPVSRITNLHSVTRDGLVDDMVHCEDISEPAILWNIKERFNVNKIYTRIGGDRKPNELKIRILLKNLMELALPKAL